VDEFEEDVEDLMFVDADIDDADPDGDGRAPQPPAGTG
jgi:hypothetical protein